jgi:NhaP-type Na+/H+ or K+/H+ antiporter
MFELSGVIILGIFAQWLAWRIRLPAILPLIIIGLLVGPLSVFWTTDGQQLINPIYNPTTGRGLFPGKNLFNFVSLAIGIILFEGSLTLKRQEVQQVGLVIINLISIGSLVTFLGGGLATHLILGLSWPMAFMFSSLIVVTGPTVIAPILRNIPLSRNVATVLKWESILIEPVGALCAVLVYDFILSADDGLTFSSHAFVVFAQIVLTGLAMGAIAAYTLYQMIKQEMAPPYLLNVFTLSYVLGVFVLSNNTVNNSGLLTVVVMGTVMANLEVPRLKEILTFKENIATLLISVLFILLASNIKLADLNLVIHNPATGLLFAVVIFVLRPLGVFLSTIRSTLTFREKIFISFVGPRGIVAAGIASLFGLSLVEKGIPAAEYIIPLVLMIVVGSVLLIALSARPLAKILGLIQDTSGGILIVGASLAARLVAKYLHDNHRHVVLVDINEANITRARETGLNAFVANLYTEDLSDKLEINGLSTLLALTSNPEVNEYAVRRYKKDVGEAGVFRIMTAEELLKGNELRPKHGLFSNTDDFLNLNEVARDFPKIHEMTIEDIPALQRAIQSMSAEQKTIPLLIKIGTGEISPLPSDLNNLKFPNNEALKLVYLGRDVDGL